jgi:hypothetical protein
MNLVVAPKPRSEDTAVEERRLINQSNNARPSELLASIASISDIMLCVFVLTATIEGWERAAGLGFDPAQKRFKKRIVVLRTPFAVFSYTRHRMKLYTYGLNVTVSILR